MGVVKLHLWPFKVYIVFFRQIQQKNLQSGKNFLSLILSWTHSRKISYRKLQVSRDPSKFFQPKDFRGEKSIFVQNFFKCHLKDQPVQRSFVIKPSIKN